MRDRVAIIVGLIEAILGDHATTQELRELQGALSSCQVECQARFISKLLTARSTDETRLLTAEQAAQLLAMPVRSIYRNAHKWEFTRRPSPGLLRFDESGLRKYIGRKA